MSDEGLRGVVIGHGGVAPALVAAAEEISGILGVLAAVSNSNCDKATLEAAVDQAVDGRHAILFVDLPSGSCFHACLARLRAGLPVHVVTGVNLAMLLDFLFHRHLDAAQVVEHAVAVGGKAIAVPPIPPCPSS